MIQLSKPSIRAFTYITLGMNACEAGYRVKFYIAAELAEAVQMNRLARLKKSPAR